MLEHRDAPLSMAQPFGFFRLLPEMVRVCLRACCWRSVGFISVRDLVTSWVDTDPGIETPGAPPCRLPVSWV